MASCGSRKQGSPSTSALPLNTQLSLSTPNSSSWGLTTGKLNAARRKLLIGGPRYHRNEGGCVGRQLQATEETLSFCFRWDSVQRREDEGIHRTSLIPSAMKDSHCMWCHVDGSALDSTRSRTVWPAVLEKWRCVFWTRQWSLDMLRPQRNWLAC